LKENSYYLELRKLYKCLDLLVYPFVCEHVKVIRKLWINFLEIFVREIGLEKRDDGSR